MSELCNCTQTNDLKPDVTVNESLFQPQALLLHLHSHVSGATTPPSEMSRPTHELNQGVNVASEAAYMGMTAIHSGFRSRVMILMTIQALG